MATPETPENMLTHAADQCERVAAEVKAIGAAAARVVNGPLTMDAVAMLVRENLQRGFKTTIGVEDVKAVLYSAATLHVHLKPAKAVK